MPLVCSNMTLITPIMGRAIMAPTIPQRPEKRMMPNTVIKGFRFVSLPIIQGVRI